jgi:hypothetical protein
MSLLAGLAGLVVLAATPERAAAEVQLPPRNPRARVTQRVGLTDISVEYNSPAVGGRQIWGRVVPYGAVWRTGELPVPKISFSRDVDFGGARVPAGTYALLTIPSAGDWTVILNRNAKLTGERDYRAELDVARVKVASQAAPHRERFAFVFAEFTDDQTLLQLEWEKLRVSVPIGVHTKEQLAAEIDALDGVWRKYADIARYLLEKGDYDAGLTYIDRSIVLKRDGYNLAIRASLLEAKGRDGRATPDRAPGALAMQLDGKLKDGILSEPAIAKLPLPPDSGTLATRRPGSAPASPPAEALPPVVPDAEPFSSIAERGGARIEPARTPFASLGERSVRVHGAGATPARAPGSDEIAPLIKKGKADIQGCYQRSLRRDPSLTRGRITISVTVGVSGLVKNVALDPPGQFKVLEPCIKDAISRWVFPLSPIEYGTEFPVVLHGH